MKKNKITTVIVLMFMIVTLTIGCKAQTSIQPKYIGKAYGKLDLEKIDFNENIDTLFSKTDHWILPETQEKYVDSNKPLSYVLDTMNFIYRIKNAKLNNNNQFKFGDININLNHVDFYVTKAGKFVGIGAVVRNIVNSSEIKKILEKIHNKYKKFEVFRNEMADGSYPSEWNMPDKIIVFTYRLGKSKDESNTIILSIITKNNFEQIPTYIKEWLLFR